MGKRKVEILDAAATRVAEIAMFIEAKGLPETAKRFVDDAFGFLLNKDIPGKLYTYIVE